MCFSTLCGSKWIGTVYALLMERVYGVSVPSAGRNGLELGAINRMPDAVCGVSVPSAGRNGLEPHHPGRGSARTRSFSTLCGSKWIGTIAASQFLVACRGFSTLCGSKWIGTKIMSVDRSRYPRFQYPLRVEMDWNKSKCDLQRPSKIVSVPSAGRNGLEPLIRHHHQAFAVFQYPLRVEMDWNATVNQFGNRLKTRFSTLCGSKWIGTNPPGNL